MRKTIIKCQCDKCESSMSEYEYDRATRIDIKVRVPHPEGKCGETNGTTMVICEKCSRELNLSPEEIHQGTYDDKNRIGISLEKFKNKILEMFF